MIRAGRGDAHGGGNRKLGLYGIVVVTSAVPCPGAVVMLLFALYLDLTLIGIAGVLAMSLGMGIVVSAAGYLAYFGRTGLFSRLKGKERLVGVVSDLMELGSYCLVLGFSLFMAWPFLAAFW
jgi:ABC-type nickel/cobalt efflux system permease component RcnA